MDPTTEQATTPQSEPAVQILDAGGAPVSMPNAGLDASGQPLQAVRANAATAAGAAIHTPLTSFATGFPQEPVDELVDFFAPFVPVPLWYQYRAKALANQLGATDNDAVGPSGDVGRVVMDSESMVSDKLIFRGLETPFMYYDQQLASSMPGNSMEMERETRTEFLLGEIRRGRAYRVIQSIAASAKSPTSVTIYADDDPFAVLRDYVNAVKVEAGGPAYMRAVLGYDAFSGFQDHPVLNGTSAGVSRDVPPAMIANRLGLPEASIRVSWHQFVTTKQGKSASKSDVVGNLDLWLYVCHPQPNRNDNTWLKTFGLQSPQGGMMEVYTYNPTPNAEQIGARYFEKVTNTNTASNAAKRLQLTFDAGNRT